MRYLTTSFVLLLITSAISDAQEPSTPGASEGSGTKNNESPAGKNGSSADEAAEGCPQSGGKCKDLLKYRTETIWNVTKEIPEDNPLQHIIDCACMGDTIALLDSMKINQSVTINKSIEITTMPAANAYAKLECTGNSSGIFNIKASVNISRIEIANCNVTSEREYTSSIIIIDGDDVIRLEDIVFHDNNGDGAVLFASNANVEISNLHAYRNNMSVLSTKNSKVTLKNSNLTDNGQINKTNGGALRFDMTNVTMKNVSFQENKGQNGGAVYAKDSNITTHNCTFKNNNATDGGSFWFTDVNNVRVSKSFFIKNTAYNDGGVIKSENTRLSLHNCTFQNNSATDAGGCMKIKEGYTEVTDTLMKNNSAAFGAVIRSERGNLIFKHVDFTRNTASNTGGGCYFDDDANIFIEYCSFQENEALYGGAFYSQKSSNFTMRHTILERNEAGLIGGGASIDHSKLTFLNVTCKQNNAPYGGGYHLLSVHMKGSELLFANNKASEGGAFVARESTINVTRNHLPMEVAFNPKSFGMILTENRALDSGGGIAVDSSDLFIHASHFEKNKASKGGALQVRNTNNNLEITESTFTNNSADTLGGSLYFFVDSESALPIKLKDVKISNSTALLGGGIHSLSVSLSLDGCEFYENYAHQDGGAVYIINVEHPEKTVLAVKNSTIHGCNAKQSGGAIYAAGNKNATMKVSASSSNLSNNNAESRNGGGMMFRYTKQSKLDLVRLTENHADKSGGGIRLVKSILKSDNVTFEGNDAVNGAGLSLDVQSSFVCGACSFLENNARSHGLIPEEEQHSERPCSVGGGIHAESSNKTRVAVKCIGCKFSKNEAKYGAGIHFIKKPKLQHTCEGIDTWGGVIVEDSMFESNEASARGSAIHSNAKECIFVNFSEPKFLSEFPDLRISKIRRVESENLSDHCLHENKTSMVSTYVTHVRLNNCSTWKLDSSNVYRTEDFVSGGTLPKLQLVAYDAYNQSKAHSRNGTIRATIEEDRKAKPLGLDNRTIDMRDGVGQLSERSTRNVPHGNYTMNISFGEEGVKPIRVVVVVRPCKIGERNRSSSALSCEQCEPGTYNFDSTSEQCKLCPSNAYCSGDFVVPEQGYWHSNPCHVNLTQCLNAEACTGTNITRMEEIKRADCTCNDNLCNLHSNLTEHLFGIHDNRTALLLHLANRYSKNAEECKCRLLADPRCWKDEAEDLTVTYEKALCAEGYKGILCGECSEGYGRKPSFRCSICWSEFALSAVLIGAVIWMLVVVAITIRGNRIACPDVIADMFPQRHQGSRSLRAVLPEVETSGAPQRIGDQNSDSSDNIGIESTEASSESADRLALEKRVQLSKWKLCEIIKVMVNFLQAVAVASLINVDWTSRVKNLLVSVDIAGGASVEAISSAVYCLTEGRNVKQSVITQVVGLVGPLMIAVLYAIFHMARCIWKNEEMVVYKKRTILSFLAVLYFSYLTITKQSVMVFMHVDVHISDGCRLDETSKYWAQDTSVEYYSSEHKFLIVVAFLFLISITFGFPITSAIVLRRFKERASLGPQGPVYDRMGFLYRAFRPDIPYWESLIMARKAALSLIAVFSYDLGGVKQSLLAIMVLLIAMYWHARCMPYRDEFGFINTFELCSLFVSCLIFVFATFFSEGVASGPVREFLSFFVIMPIVIFVVWTCREVFFNLVEYFSDDLDAVGRRYKGNSRLFVIWRWIAYRLGFDEPSANSEHELAVLA